MSEIAVVIGSTSNIGQAIAEGLSADGYHAVVTSRHGDEAETVVTSLPNEGSSFEVDVTDPDRIDALFEFVDGLDGDLTVLVNSVAYTANESILECDLDTWETTLDTNLRSYFLCSKAAGERMKDTGGGAIVNITISRRSGSSGKLSYSVSKGGVDMLTKCAALDLAPYGIRVNAVGSGVVGTPVGHRELGARAVENDRFPVGHIGEPADIAEAVRFLVSDRAKYVVGGMIPVDGGKEVSW